MPKGQPVTPETKARALELMAEGKLGRNAIARELEVSGAVITKIAADAGHVFDWKTTEIAVRAANVQNAEIRATLARAALLRALDALDAMNAPHDEVHWQATTENQAGGWQVYTHPVPSPTDQRNYATVFGIMTQRAAELMRSTEGAASPDAVSHLEGLAGSLQAVAEHLKAQHEAGAPDPDDPTIEPTAVSRESLLEQLGGDDDAERNE